MDTMLPRENIDNAKKKKNTVTVFFFFSFEDLKMFCGGKILHTKIVE